MEYKSNSDTRTFDYSYIHNYGQAKCGSGVTAPTFKVYAFGSHFEKLTKPLPLCSTQLPPQHLQHYSREYRAYPYSTMAEFDKMMRTKNT
jgi:hypothetical protein